MRRHPTKHQSLQASIITDCRYSLLPLHHLLRACVHTHLSCVSKNLFIGVVGAEATMESYVGADAHGWGYLANRAIWHDKAKVRYMSCNLTLAAIMQCAEA